MKNARTQEIFDLMRNSLLGLNVVELEDLARKLGMCLREREIIVCGGENGKSDVCYTLIRVRREPIRFILVSGEDSGVQVNFDGVEFIARLLTGQIRAANNETARRADEILDAHRKDCGVGRKVGRKRGYRMSSWQRDLQQQATADQRGREFTTALCEVLHEAGQVLIGQKCTMGAKVMVLDKVHANTDRPYSALFYFQNLENRHNRECYDGIDFLGKLAKGDLVPVDAEKAETVRSLIWDEPAFARSCILS